MQALLTGLMPCYYTAIPPDGQTEFAGPVLRCALCPVLHGVGMCAAGVLTRPKALTYVNPLHGTPAEMALLKSLQEPVGLCCVFCLMLLAYVPACKAAPEKYVADYWLRGRSSW